MSARAALLALALAAPAAKAEPTASFELRPTTGPVTAGAPFELPGIARYPAGFSLSLRLEGQDTGPFAVLGVEAGAPKSRGEILEQPVRLRLMGFALGPQTFPALSWTLASPGSNAALKSPPARLTLTAPAPRPGDTEDIRDIRPPLPAPLGRLLFLAAAAVALLGALAAAALRARRGGARPPAAPARELAPHERALEELERLRASPLGAREYYGRLSDALRRYLEPRFGVPAPRMTSSGLLRALRAAQAAPGLLSGLRPLLERSDLAKFARLSPDPTDREEDRLRAVELVRASIPPPEPAQSPPGKMLN